MFANTTDNIIALLLLTLAVSLGASTFRTNPEEHKKLVARKVKDMENVIKEFNSAVALRDSLYKEYKMDLVKYKGRSNFASIVGASQSNVMTAETKIRSIIERHNRYCRELKKLSKEAMIKVCNKVAPINFYYKDRMNPNWDKNFKPLSFD